MRLKSGDEDRLASVLCHPEVFPHLHDDNGAKTPADLDLAELLADRDIFFLMPAPGTLVIAEWLFSATYELHQAAVPESRGATMLAAGREAVAWLFANAPGCRKLVGFTPAYNRAAIVMARRVGFQVEGRIRNCFLKGGALHDVVVLGLSPGQGG